MEFLTAVDTLMKKQSKANYWCKKLNNKKVVNSFSNERIKRHHSLAAPGKLLINKLKNEQYKDLTLSLSIERD